jgi:hypothetical protein
MTPAPGDSSRPRANTTSMGEQEADALGISLAGASTEAVARSPATAKNVASLTGIDCRGAVIGRSFMDRY